MCEMLKVSPQGYYQWKNHGKSNREYERLILQKKRTRLEVTLLVCIVLIQIVRVICIQVLNLSFSKIIITID